MESLNVTIVRATLEDAEALLALQKLAYRSEAELYNDFSIPPLLQTLEQLRQEFASWIVLKALVDSRLVGSVRIQTQDGTCHVERLIVAPDVQGRGIGTRLLRELESYVPSGTRFELFTGHRSERNIRLYNRVGYRIFKCERVHDALSLVYMEKRT